MIKIEGVCNGIELDKRFYLPGVVLSDECPKCKEIVEKDLGDDYLSYPVVGKPYTIDLYCEPCDHYWVGKVLVEVTIKVAQPKKKVKK